MRRFSCTRGYIAIQEHIKAQNTGPLALTTVSRLRTPQGQSNGWPPAVVLDRAGILPGRPFLAIPWT